MVIRVSNPKIGNPDKTMISDNELLSQFKEVENLSQEDKHLIKTSIDAFLNKRKI